MTKKKYQFMAAIGFLLGFVGLANLGYLMAGEKLTTGTLVLLITGVIGIALGVTAVVQSHKVS